jgi:hypothetical protein
LVMTEITLTNVFYVIVARSRRPLKRSTHSDLDVAVFFHAGELDGIGHEIDTDLQHPT